MPISRTTSARHGSGAGLKPLDQTETTPAFHVKHDPLYSRIERAFGVKNSHTTAQVRRLSAEIGPSFAKVPSDIVGATLADLLARWLACHVAQGSVAETIRLRRGLLAAHIQSVKALTEIKARMLSTDQEKQGYANQGSEGRKGNQSLR